MAKIIVFGGAGWIGQQAVPLLQRAFDTVLVVEDVRADDEAAVKRLLDAERPSHVLCMIGRTHGEGCNTIDYLEQPGKLQENIRDNLYAPLVLAHNCHDRAIHFTYLGTGCIFSAPPPREFLEADRPNFFGSSYSIVKGFTDRFMHLYPFALNVRIRMPITNLHHPRNFISKIISYEKICNNPNSMTVLPTLLPFLVDMIHRCETGTVNLVNPGVITHNEILALYQKYVDPGFTWVNFTEEEQNKILASKRSNNTLSTAHLEEMYPDVIPHIHEAVEAMLQTWNVTIDQEVPFVVSI